MSPDFADFGPPLPVEGGLRARSTRGAIGRSWWSRRFLEVLESFALGTRLTRGRAYARRGQVRWLRVAPGEVVASVQGSRPHPYAVRIGLPAYPDPVWRRVEQHLAAQALYAARLLAGELPAELEELFVDAGAPLFPASIDELDLSCGCPDVAVPCKHLAAVCYLLAEAFDADPFELLHWRGRDRARLLGRLRELRGATGVPPGGPAAASGAGRAEAAPPDASPPEAPRSGAEPATPVGAAAVLADLPTPPRQDDPASFWSAPVPLPPRPPVLDAPADLLLRQLPPPAAAIGGPGLVERLRPAYERFAADQAG